MAKHSLSPAKTLLESGNEEPEKAKLPEESMELNCRIGKSKFVRDLVSVIIPTKNSETHIHRALNAICNQTYKNIEIIIVDNYSTDITCSIARRYGA